MLNYPEQAKDVILFLLSQNISTRPAYETAMRDFYTQHKGAQYLAKDKLLEAYRELRDSGEIVESIPLRKLLIMKATRSSSGIVVVSVLTKPYACPGKCLYCPTEKDVPKSYLSTEPAVMRAIKCGYDPFLQVKSRLDALNATGHPISKINIRIVGGTFSVYKKDYRDWFIRELFRACNEYAGETFNDQTLEELQTRNSSSAQRLVEISIETRQDYIKERELLYYRELGVTKVELGVQSIYDDVLLLNKRGHDVSETVRATKLLRDFGFKIAYQIMLNLPGSDFQRDLEMMRELFTNPDFKPDHLKIYPLALVEAAEVYQWYQEGRFKPYDEQELTELLVQVKQLIPYYCRVERVIRDIPAESVVEGGAKVSNMRQVVQLELQKRGLKCKCIRCREPLDAPMQEIRLFRDDYQAGNSTEIFLSFESPDRQTLYSLLRLRINNEAPQELLSNSGLVREMHTYGKQLSVGEANQGQTQHKGLGSKLLKEAERIVFEEFNLNKIAVIAGVGVREYFQKQGYEIRETYMFKKLEVDPNLK